ncbi:hypothetical protein [Roseinatronobacter monicus]|uniref:Argininosuccinate lyase n=1 Tax=Roseinatronobacter monicus TaxID=393481 RepID=A0A543KAE9_9RHOB|nr:hypothetical protein [Roseinatronobacter monicus]TQM92029.1 hypothetical protein BD293_0615 [Roseinatronobacter monicus]
MKYAALAVLLALAACGAEAPPTHPGQPAAGIGLSGEVTMGAKTRL